MPLMYLSYDSWEFISLKNCQIVSQSGTILHPHSNTQEILFLWILTGIWCDHHFYFDQS